MRKLIIAAFLLILTGPAYGASPEALNRADDLIEAGDLKGAEALLREALEEEPERGPLLRKLSSVLKKRKAYKEAASLLLKASEVGKAQHRRGQILEAATIYSWAKEYSRSIELYDSLLAQNPDDKGALLGRSRVYSWNKRYDEAIGGYERVLELDPGNTTATIGLARIRSWTRNYDKAVELYREILEDDPEDREARFGLVKVLSWSGEDSDAMEELRALLKYHPDDKEALEMERCLFKEEGPELNLNRGEWEDSDDNHVITYKAKLYYKHSRKTKLYLTYSLVDAEDLIRMAKAKNLSLKATHKLDSGLRLSGSLSLSASESSTAPESDTTLSGFSLSARKKLTGKVKGSAYLSNYRLTDTALLIINAIRVQELGASLSGRYSFYDLRGGFALASYSDTNSRTQFDFDASRTFQKERYDIVVGYEFLWRKFSKDLTSGYFDPPTAYISNVIYGAINNSLCADKLYYRLLAALGTSSHSGKSSTSTKLEAKLLYQVTDRLDVYASYKVSNSSSGVTGGSGYEYRGSNIGLNYIF